MACMWPAVASGVSQDTHARGSANIREAIAAYLESLINMVKRPPRSREIVN
jgi:hypothetical protein